MMIVSVMVYGPPGSGKTHFIGQVCRKFGSALVIDVEGGTLPVHRVCPSAKRVRTPAELTGEGVEVITLPQFSAVRQVIQYVRGRFRGQYYVGVIDSLTELSYAATQYALSDRREVGFRSDERPGLQDYLDALNALRALIRDFRETFPVSIVTCLEQYRVEELPPNILPALTGRLQHEVPALMDEVWRLIRASGGRVVLTCTSGSAVAKSRLGLSNIEVPEQEWDGGALLYQVASEYYELLGYGTTSTVNPVETQTQSSTEVQNE